MYRPVSYCEFPFLSQDRPYWRPQSAIYRRSPFLHTRYVPLHPCDSTAVLEYMLTYMPEADQGILRLHALSMRHRSSPLLCSHSHKEQSRKPHM